MDESMMMPVKCSQCGVEFNVYRCRAKYKKTNRWFCSHECHRNWAKGENSPTWRGGGVEVECFNCGIKFKRWPKEVARYQKKYCSKRCREIGSVTVVETECTYCGARITKRAAYIKKYPVSFCDRGCRAEWMVQENNPAWNNGSKSEPYCPLWLDTEYKKSIRERDGNVCANPACLKTTGRLCVHHIDYNKKNCEPFNLITLCNSCNSIANTDREWHEQWFKTIMNRRYRIEYRRAA
jgi:hypothetical protein